MMLRLNVIVHNPAGDGAITWFGVVLLALVAAMIVALWVVVARQLARRPDDESDSDSGLETLRHLKLVVRRSGSRREPQAPVVAELEPDGESELPGSSAR